MGRAPCCDKTKVKRGPWSPEEDATLIRYLDTHGTGSNWIALPQKAGLRRCGKSCRLRWLNYLRPDIKHGNFTEDEDEIICTLYNQMGSRWSLIASSLPGRTDNDVKNYWNTKLKKKLLAGKVILTNKIINSNKLHGSCPDLLDSSTPSTYHHLHFSSVSSQPQISSSPFPILPGTGYGSTHFPHPEMAAGVSEFSTNMKNGSSPIFTPSHQDSADSGLAVGTINAGTRSSTVEEGGILMDFGFGNGAPYNYYEYIIDNGQWFQDRKASHDDDEEAALSYCYPNLFESSSYADIKPQGLSQSVINQY